VPSTGSPYAASPFTDRQNGYRPYYFRAVIDATATRFAPPTASPDAVATPIFGKDDETHWLSRQYKKLCDYTHGNPGHTNMDLLSSNGPIFVPAVLRRVEDEFRETLALSYLLLKLGCSSYQPTEGIANLLSGSTKGWQEYHQFLISELSQHRHWGCGA
jgi:hypothetical protein